MNPAAEVGTSTITDHLFNPPDPWRWWDRCARKHCRLGAAAHAASAIVLEPSPWPPYRCPDCVQRDRAWCAHQFKRERA